MSPHRAVRWRNPPTSCPALASWKKVDRVGRCDKPLYKLWLSDRAPWRYAPDDRRWRTMAIRLVDLLVDLKECGRLIGPKMLGALLPKLELHVQRSQSGKSADLPNYSSFQRKVDFGERSALRQRGSHRSEFRGDRQFRTDCQAEAASASGSVRRSAKRLRTVLFHSVFANDVQY